MAFCFTNLPHKIEKEEKSKKQGVERKERGSITGKRKTESLKVRDGRKRERGDREIREKQRGAPLLEVSGGGGGSHKKGGEGPMTRDQ